MKDQNLPTVDCTETKSLSHDLNDDKKPSSIKVMELATAEFHLKHESHE